MRAKLDAMRATTAEVMAKAHKMREDCLIEEEEDQYLKENPYGQTAEGMRERIVKRRSDMVTTL